jgi:hypothetical protein
MKAIIVIITCLLVYTKTLMAQNVGIGTSNPTRAKLEVHGSVGATAAIFGGDTTGISLQSNWPTIGFNEYFNGGQRYIAKGYAAQQFLDPNLGYIAFDIFSHGNANALATSSRRPLSMNSGGSVFLGDGQSRIYINRFTNSGVVPATLEINQFQGRGISIIEALTGHYWQMSSVVGSPPFLELEYDGILKGLFRSVTGEYVTFSDSRLKKNIQPIATVLDKVLRLSPVKYEMKDNNPRNESSIGFIAQNVKDVFPELVTTINDATGNHKHLNGFHALNYNGFGVIAIKAIQEQQEIIEQLTRLNNQQQQAIVLLEKRMKEFEAKMQSQ